MKQVIKENKKYVVSVEEVNSNKIYAVKIGSEIGLITRERFGDGNNYHVTCLDDEFTNNNGWSGYGGTKLRVVISNVIEMGNKVFEFDTFKEFAEWYLGEVK